MADPVVNRLAKHQIRRLQGPYVGAKPGIGYTGPKKHGKHRRRTSLGSGNVLPGQKVKY